VDAIRGGGPTRWPAWASTLAGGAAHRGRARLDRPAALVSPRATAGTSAGVSAARHPATEKLTVFVYDGHDGGAGFRRARLPGPPADWPPRHQAGHRPAATAKSRLPLLRAVRRSAGNGNHPLVQARSSRPAGHGPGPDTGPADAGPADAGLKVRPSAPAGEVAAEGGPRNRRAGAAGGGEAAPRTHGFGPGGGGRLRPI